MKDIQKHITPNAPKNANEQLDGTQYPASEDIYNKFDKEFDIDPEDISKKKDVIKINNKNNFNEVDFDDDQTGEDLDVPGSDLDEEEGTSGNEDEENNYYSIGGDDHNDLDEDKI